MILPGLKEFLADYTDKTQRYYNQNLVHFRSYLEKKLNLDSFQDVERIHIKSYFSDLNKNNWRSTTKEKKYQVVNLYLKYLFEYEFIQKQLTIKKPKFSDYINKDIQEKLSLALPSPEDIKELLKHAKKVNNTMFILMSLLFHNGMRISEVISIMIKNIDIQERVIITGLISGSSKAGVCYYYIPKKMVSELNFYLKKLKNKYNNPKFLFPGDGTPGHIQRQNASRNIEKYAEILNRKGILGKFKTNPHSFRHSLNHERLKLGCNDSLMAILLNQVPKGTNAQYYLKMVRNDFITRRNFWDKFTPDYL